MLVHPIDVLPPATAAGLEDDGVSDTDELGECVAPPRLPFVGKRRSVVRFSDARSHTFEPTLSERNSHLFSHLRSDRSGRGVFTPCGVATPLMTPAVATPAGPSPVWGSWNDVCRQRCEAIRAAFPVMLTGNATKIRAHREELYTQTCYYEAPLLGSSANAAPMLVKGVDAFVRMHVRLKSAIPDLHGSVDAVVPWDLDCEKADVHYTLTGMPNRPVDMLTAGAYFCLQFKATLQFDRTGRVTQRFCTGCVLPSFTCSAFDRLPSVPVVTGDRPAAVSLSLMATIGATVGHSTVGTVASAFQCQDDGSELMARLLDPVRRDAALVRVQQTAWPFAATPVGSRVVQKALDVAKDTRAQVAVAAQLRGHVAEAAISSSANFVVQRVIEVLPAEELHFVFLELNGCGAELAAHRYGSRVVQRMVEGCPWWQSASIIDEILAVADKLARHSFGNFVIQHILEHGTRAQRKRIAGVIFADIGRFVVHRVGTHVVCAVLKHAEPEDVRPIAETIIADSCSGNTTTSEPLRSGVLIRLSRRALGQAQS